MNEYIVASKNQGIASEFIQHGEALLGFAMKLVRNEDDAKDLVQDTYLRALNYADHYTPGTHARSWLYRILYNLFINQYRRKKRSPIVDVVEHDEQRSTHVIDPEAFRHALSDEVMLAFNSLKPEFKTVLYLRDFEDLKYEEIAQILQVPVCTIKTRIHRARLYMRRKLAKLKAFAMRN